MGKITRRRRSLPSLILLLCLGAPAGAHAQMAWQAPEALPQGVTPAPADSSSPGAAQLGLLDSKGRALVAMDHQNKPWFSTRPNGGPLSAPQPFPTPLSNDSAKPLIAGNANGDAIAFKGPRWTFRAAGSPSFGELAQLPNGYTIHDIAMAPTGEAMALIQVGLAEVRVAFRPAGPSAQFDVENATILLPVPGHTRTQPVGIAMDADGGAVVLYRSTNPDQAAYALLQSVRPAGGGFQEPTEIPGYPGFYGSFDAADDGTAVLVHYKTYTGYKASVRAPGGSFGQTQTVVENDQGEVGGVAVAAVNGGRAVVAWNHGGKPVSCGAKGSAADYGWRASVFSGGGWGSLGAGPATFPNSSSVLGVRAAGDKVALVVRETGFTGTGLCDTGDPHGVVRVRSGAIGDLGNATTLESWAPPATPGARPPQPDMTALLVGAAGNVLVGTKVGFNDSHKLTAYEDKLAPGDDKPDTTGKPGDGNQGGGSGGGGTPPAPVIVKPAITAPPALVIKGPIGVSHRMARVPFSCPIEVDCGVVMRIFGVKSRSGATAAAAARAKPLGTAKGTVPAGSTKTFKVRLNRAALRTLTRKKTLKVRIEVKVTAGGRTTTINRTAKLKLK
jgi:hypothetical protein